MLGVVAFIGDESALVFKPCEGNSPVLDVRAGTWRDTAAGTRLARAAGEPITRMVVDLLADRGGIAGTGSSDLVGTSRGARRFGSAGAASVANCSVT